MKDKTGNRRFLPISIKVKDESDDASEDRINRMAAIVPQLYGEAMHEFDKILKEQEAKGSTLSNYALRLKDRGAQEMAKQAQEDRMSPDDRGFKVQKFLDNELEGMHIPAHIPVLDGKATEVLSSDISLVVFGEATPDSKRQKQLGHILSQLGWDSSRVRIKTVRGKSTHSRIYKRPLTPEEQEKVVGMYGVARRGDELVKQSNIAKISKK